MCEGGAALQPDVNDVVFGRYSDAEIRGMGLNPRDVSRWGVTIARGNVPPVFPDLCTLQLTILLARREHLRDPKMRMAVEKQIVALCGE